MQIKTSLLGGAALVLVLAAATAAEARPAHRSSVAASQLAAQAEEIRLLKAQVAALAARVDAQDAAAQDAKATAQQAQASAQTAAAQATQAQTQTSDEIRRIPTEVSTAVAALPKPKPGWWESTTVSGRMYADLSHIEQKSDGVPQPANGTSFDIKRFYVSIDHTFNSTFSADVTTDFTYDSGPAGATQLYLKKAYLQAKLNDALVLRFGSADLPWVPFAEEVYGYRYIDPTLIDRTKFGTSADWGVHALGKLPAGPVTFNYAVALINGAGYKKPGFNGSNRSNTMDVEGRVSANIDHFVLGVGGYSGKLGKDVEGTPTYNRATRFDALAAYVDPRFRLGVEYFHSSDWNDVTQPVAALTNASDGWSVFGSAKLTDQWSVFGRYDWEKPKRDTTPAMHDNYFNVGVQYEPVKIVDLALVYKRDKVEDGLLSTSNGTIGGVGEGTYDEVGLFTQLRW